MKKSLSTLVIAFTIVSSFSFQSCILDAFDFMYINLWMPATFNVSGTTPLSSVSKSICLDASSVYRDYADKVESIQFVTAAFRTIDIGTGATGNLTLTIANSTGTPLFVKTLTNVNISNFATTPASLSLTDAEVTAVNTYLSTSSNRCFTATLAATGISPTPFNFQGSMDIAFRMKVKLLAE
ncbi:MAG: hypothetical protein KJ666_07430 [Bacteroidetes bacterium]|nr:hypothetical protein [Bacteroidota bacterium]MBU2585777.1 hypothetical protein [Bacteroidota bacterium]